MLLPQVIPGLLRGTEWRRWSISSDNGPHFAQSYIFYALSQLAVPTTLQEVCWSFDCPYHGMCRHHLCTLSPGTMSKWIRAVAYVGKDLCDPEGGCTKRRIDALQLQLDRAFRVGREAFEALCKDVEWSRVAVQRNCGDLDTFVERRTAVWVGTKDLQAKRDAVPKLSSLAGIRSWVYGVRFQPDPYDFAPKLQLSQFLCFCNGCKTFPRTACLFPELSRVRKEFQFKVNRVTSATIKELMGFLSLQQPAVVGVHKSQGRDHIVGVVARHMSWAQGERERCTTTDALLQAVSKKYRAWQASRDQALAAAEQARLQASHEARLKRIAQEAQDQQRLRSELHQQNLNVRDLTGQLEATQIELAKRQSLDLSNSAAAPQAAQAVSAAAIVAHKRKAVADPQPKSEAADVDLKDGGRSRRARPRLDYASMASRGSKP
jgi:hypothetical protein